MKCQLALDHKIFTEQIAVSELISTFIAWKRFTEVRRLEICLLGQIFTVNIYNVSAQNKRASEIVKHLRKMLKILSLIESTFSRGSKNKTWRPFHIISQRQLAEIGNIHTFISTTYMAVIICPKSLFIMFNIVVILI